MSNIVNVLNLRIKLIFRNITTTILSVIIIFIFITLIGSLYSNMDESLKVNIAYVIEEESHITDKIAVNLTNNKLLSSVNTTKSEGLKLVKDGGIEALFIIKDDFYEKIKKGDFDNIIQVYYLKENRLAPMVEDIFVGEILEEISITTSLNYLEDAIKGNKDKNRILEDAYNYSKKLSNERKEEYYVNTTYVNIDKEEIISLEKLGNEIIYKQMIYGIVLMFCSFFILFIGTNIVKDKENKIIKKILITRISKIQITIGDYLSLIIPTILIILSFSIINGYYSNDFIKAFFINFIIIFIYSCVFSGIILILTRIINSVSAFIVISSSMTILFGIISGCFFNIDLSLLAIKKTASLTPSYHALTKLLNYLVYNNTNNLYQYVINTCFVIVFLLILSIGLLRQQENKI